MVVKQWKKDVNCVKAGVENTDHAAYDHKCPSILKLVEKNKKAHESHLNSTNPTMVIYPVILFVCPGMCSQSVINVLRCWNMYWTIRLMWCS